MSYRSNARRALALTVTVAGFSAGMAVAPALGATSPNGPGQPGAPGTTCGSPNATATPGNSVSANGSPFNPAGVSGPLYAGSPDSPTVSNGANAHAVSQYDIACFQATQNHS